MSLVFCRGCGKEIHETASMCPNCGYEYLEIKKEKANNNWWLVGFSALFSLINFVSWFQMESWTREVKVGLMEFGVLSLVLSLTSLALRHRGKLLNIICIVISTITIVLLIVLFMK
jgi:lipid-A-disaccharide synthase-like uncharacterized protein